MRVAVISDIHGNMQALDAVLEDIKRENCERTVCLGDLAMAGPEPVNAIELIKKLYDDGKVDLIQGNTDEMIANYEQFGEKVKAAFPIMGNALESDISLIPHHLKEFLNNLPKQKKFTIEGIKVLLVHGSPRKNDENILPDLPLEQVEEMVAGTDADLILCGHTHIPCGYQTTSKQTIVNDGSVGRPFTPIPQACYALVDFSNGAFEVKHKFINYDREKAAEILLKRNFEGADKLAKILIKPEFRHI